MENLNEIVTLITYLELKITLKMVSLPYKQRAFIIYDNDVTLSLT